MTHFIVFGASSESRAVQGNGQCVGNAGKQHAEDNQAQLLQWNFITRIVGRCYNLLFSSVPVGIQ